MIAPTRWLRSVLLALGSSISVFAAEPEAAEAPKLDYNRDIRPILSDNCFACHGPDKTRAKPASVSIRAKARSPY